MTAPFPLTRFLSRAAFAALLAGAPAALPAQTPDFGADTSPWALDGECDDPRFQGPGMTTTTLLDSDIRADATDCRNAFNMGTISLIGGATTDVTTTVPGKTPPGQAGLGPAHPSGIVFGDDTGRWPNDGECDDRRFVGAGMTTAGMTMESVGRDATDCRTAFDAGRIRLWDFAQARAATQCAAINFGNDSGDYPDDGECDDPRFDGQGTSWVLNPEWNGRDAADCSRLCALGMIALREY